MSNDLTERIARHRGCRPDIAAKLHDAVIAVIYGPSSGEDAVYSAALSRSEWSATHIVQSLGRRGIDARIIDPTSDTFEDELAGVDVAFVNSHGSFGEDGRLQALLERAGVSFCFSGVLAQAVSLDKLVTKALFLGLSIQTPSATGAFQISGPVPENELGWPVMLKAPDGGSSLGLALVACPDDLDAAVESIRADGYDRAFFEQWVEGQPVTVSVIEVAGALTTLPPLLVGTSTGWHDAPSKLGGDECSTAEASFSLDTGVVGRLSEQSVLIGRLLRVRGAFRVDFVVDDRGDAWALEINTVPGMQLSSNLPDVARRAGLEYDDLVSLLIEAALDDGGACACRELPCS